MDQKKVTPPPDKSTPPLDSNQPLTVQKVDTSPQIGETKLNKGFFDDFPNSSPNYFANKLFLIPLVLILIIGGYLLIPTIESIINPPSPAEIYKPVSQEPKSMHLNLNGPDDQILSTDKTLVVSGKTSPKSSVVINVQYLNSETKDQNVGVEANDQGDFLRSVDLQVGINEISVFAFDPQGNSKTEFREIYYSEEKL